MAVRHLTEDPLRVVPDLQGAELASPARRFFALAIDFVLIALPNLMVVTAVAWLTLRIVDPAAFRALPAVIDATREQPPPPEALAAVAPMLVKIHAEGLPFEVERAVHEGDLERAAAVLRPYIFVFVIDVSERQEDRPLEPQTIRIRVANVIPKAGRALASYGLMGLYFGLLTAGRRGQTLGKWLLRIRVARLDGHRLSLFESIERFAGYLHIPGSLGLSLLDLWHDPNRRMAHDRVAHTAVVRVPRAAKKVAAPEPAPPAAAAAAAPEAPPASSATETRS